VTEDPLNLAGELVAALEAANIPCAIGGAIALSIWAVPRATIDIDLTLFIDSDDYAAAITALQTGGCALDEADATDRWRRGFAAFGVIDGVRVDLFTPSVPFYDRAHARVRRIEVGGHDLPFIDAESLAVFKLLFLRPKDRVDLRSLVESSGGTLDVAWVRNRIADMMGEDDERVAFWDEVVAQR